MGVFNSYKDAKEGFDRVAEQYSYWTGYITSNSFQLSGLIIAANWAVNSSVINGIRTDGYSKWSIALAMLSIVISMLIAWIQARLHKRVCDKASENPAAWQTAFDNSNNGLDPWPFTKTIERVGLFGQFTKTWLPLVSGCLLIYSVLFNG